MPRYSCTVTVMFFTLEPMFAASEEDAEAKVEAMIDELTLQDADDIQIECIEID